MATLRALTYFDVPGSNVLPGGSRTQYKEFTVGVPKFDLTKLVAAEATWDAWGHTTEDAISDFDFLWIESDLSGVLVELTCDANNGVGRVQMPLCLIAGFPLILASKVSRAGHTADFAAGTADVIDMIRVLNPSVSTGANVRAALFT